MIFMLLILLLGCVGYVTLRAYRGLEAFGLERLPKAARVAIALVPAVLCVLLTVLSSIFTAIIAIGHLVGAVIVIDLLLMLLKKHFPCDASRRGWAFAAAFLICVVYISGAIINANVIRRTDYTLTTEKPLSGGRLRIAQISDCHLGVTFDGDEFGTHLQAIGECRPDLLVITGDLVDDDTSSNDMRAACEALGEFDAPLGVYMVFGNHDGGNAWFSEKQLAECLEENGITILRDECVLLEDSFYLCGRKDAYDRTREEMESLLLPVERDRYVIVLDHQPADYAAQADAEVDLVLSGHTHGGQLLPLQFALRPLGFCDSVYGHSSDGATEYIVTSGIGGLKVPLRTGTPTEYAIIDITSEKGDITQ